MSIVKCHGAEQIRFPHQCVRCRSIPTATWTCKASAGADFILFRVGSAREILVPVCTQCKMLRSVLGFVGIVLISIAAILGFGVLLPWFDGEGLLGVWALLMFAIVLTLAYFGRNLYPRWMDWGLLGVTILRYSPTEDILDLRIRSEELAATVQATTGPQQPVAADSWEQIVMPGGPAPAPQTAADQEQFSRLDRVLRHSFVAPRLAPIIAILASSGVFALNHLYAMDQQRYFPIVVYIAPTVFLLGLAGLFNPSIVWVPGEHDFYPISRRRARIVLMALGLVLGFLLHGALYDFTLWPGIPSAGDQN